MRKLTIEKMRSLANEHGGKCLSEVYAGADTNPERVNEFETGVVRV
jgi:hypothetical protein